MVVLSGGQEDLVRRMVAPPLPESWMFADARIEGATITARYERGPARAEVTLVRRGGEATGLTTSLFRIDVRASKGAEHVRELAAALLFSVRAHEASLEWSRSAEVPPKAPSRVSNDVALALARLRALEQAGAFHEALEANEVALEALGHPPELLLADAALRASLHDDVAAAERARGALSGRGPTAARAALLLAELGCEADARAAIASSPRRDEVHAAVLFALGDYRAAAEIREGLLAGNPALHIDLGHYRAWLGDARAVESHARALTDHPAAASCLLGIADALAGDAHRALDALQRTDDTDSVAALFRAEMWLRLGDLERARAAVLRAGDLTHDRVTHASAMILRAAVLERCGAPEPLERGLVAAMTQICPDTPHDFAAALSRMRGNRAETATFVRGSDLVPVRVPRSARLASKYALWRFVATASTEETEREFDRVHEAFPSVPEPYNYRGELWLYAGDPARARLCFERALALYSRSRWAFIGLGACALLEGNPAETLAVIERGIEIAGGPGPTAYAYRGEAHRLLGHFEAARADLQHAVDTYPTRIGAWVNLGLLQAETGDASGLETTLATLRKKAPALYADAAEHAADGPPLLTEMRSMLRGNRASTCVTYFTRTGLLRTVRPAR
jgi:tetratricopeptide (TPR) repeat protein